MKWLADVAVGLVSPITGFFGKKNDNKTKIKEKNIQRLMDSDNKLAEWESIQAENSGHSWKDEFWTVILSIPLVLCFVPEYVEYIKEGFEVLKSMPEFYQYWLGVAILTSFGIRFTKR
jgi:hypothetical protein